MPFVAFRLSISFLQGCARQMQGCSKTPYFGGRIDTGRYANKLSRYQLVCNYSREFELNKENRPPRLLEAVLIFVRLSESFTHRGAGVCFCHGIEVAADVGGGAHIAVPEPFLDLLHGHTLGKYHRGAGVAKT